MSAYTFDTLLLLALTFAVGLLGGLILRLQLGARQVAREMAQQGRAPKAGTETALAAPDGTGGVPPRAEGEAPPGTWAPGASVGGIEAVPPDAAGSASGASPVSAPNALEAGQGPSDGVVPPTASAPTTGDEGASAKVTQPAPSGAGAKAGRNGAGTASRGAADAGRGSAAGIGRGGEGPAESVPPGEGMRPGVDGASVFPDGQGQGVGLGPPTGSKASSRRPASPVDRDGDDDAGRPDAPPPVATPESGTDHSPAVPGGTGGPASPSSGQPAVPSATPAVTATGGTTPGHAGTGAQPAFDLFAGLPVAEPSHPGRKPPVLGAPQAGRPDDLKLLKGIGPVNERALHRLGIFHFSQIAAWTPEEAEWVGSYLAFPGRIEREGWIGQAKAVLSGTPPQELHPPRRK